MFVGDIKEKLLIFKARTGLTQNEICEEIGITPQRFSTVLNSEKSFSVKTEEEIRLMFYVITLWKHWILNGDYSK